MRLGFGGTTRAIALTSWRIYFLLPISCMMSVHSMQKGRRAMPFVKYFQENEDKSVTMNSFYLY